MAELSFTGHASCSLGVAGDTLNTAIYLSRLLNHHPCTISYVTALGRDTFSHRIRHFIRDETIDDTFIGEIKNKNAGLYAIELDSKGERTFTYWRSDSAARQMLSNGLNKHQLDTLTTDFDLLYLSGISIAILDSKGRETLFSLLCTARKNGTTIVIDSNYREALWHSREKAWQVLVPFFKLADIALVTFDDEQALFNDETPSSTIKRIQSYSVKEIIVKQGGDGCQVQTDEFYRPCCSTTFKAHS